MNLKALLAMLLALCGPFTVLVGAGPGVVLALSALRDIRRARGGQGGQMLARTALLLSVLELAALAVALVVVASAAPEEMPVPDPWGDLVLVIAAAASTSVGAVTAWVVSGRFLPRVGRAAVLVAGAMAVVGLLAGGLAEPAVLLDCIPRCAGPDRVLPAIKGAAAAGVFAMILVLIGQATSRRDAGRAVVDDGAEAGIATALDSLRSSSDAFRHPSRRGTGGDEPRPT